MTWLLYLLIAVNAFAFILYGLDKFFAIMKFRRIPERTLWAVAFFGGPIGALLGMWFFRHKTSKVSFQFVLMLVLLVEIAIVVYVATRV